MFFVAGFVRIRFGAKEDIRILTNPATLKTYNSDDNGGQYASTFAVYFLLSSTVLDLSGTAIKS